MQLDLSANQALPLPDLLVHLIVDSKSVLGRPRAVSQ
jgi:hypothetical protein